MPRSVYFLPFAVSIVSLLANPQDPSVRAGEAQFSARGNLLEIHPTDGAVIHWNDFSIAPGETTRFLQPNASARVLNRVTGGRLSELLGTLEANGQVFLLNPHGVLIGKDAKLKTGGLFVSTFELSDENFLSGRYFEMEGDSEAKIVNCGSVQAIDGDVFLVARTVENEGEIQGANVTIGAGGDWLFRSMKTDRPGVRLSEFPPNDANIYGCAIRHSGTARAVGIREEGGRLLLISEGEIECSGTGHAAGTVEMFASSISLLGDTAIASSGRNSGGNVIVETRESTVVGPNAKIFADAFENGDGGNIGFFSEKNTEFYGYASARGGFLSGDGGEIEVSGARSFVYKPQAISVSAPKGKTGLLILDPNDINITSMAGTSGGFSNPYTGAGFAAANLFIGDLTGAGGLGSANVLVKTDAGTGGGLGDITVVDPFSWSTGFTLTLDALRNVVVEAVMEATGSGGITLIAGNNITVSPPGLASAEARTASGAISATATSDIEVLGGSSGGAHAGIFSDGGTITLSAGADLRVEGGTAAGCYAEVSSRSSPIIVANVGNDVNVLGGMGALAYGQIGFGTAPGTVVVASDITFQSVGNNVNVTGGMGMSAYAQIGHSPFPAGANTDVSGDIVFDPPNLGVGNDILVTGGMGTDATAIIGHGNELTPAIRKAEADFQIYAEGDIHVFGGSLTRTHAVIGFHTPEAGPSATYTATSTLLDVRTLISGDLLIRGGNESNGIIGYYNNSTMSASATVDITLLNAITTDSNVITLTAGNASGTAHGVAALGTLDKLGSALSNVFVQSAGLQVLGPQVAGEDGSARLINARPNVAASRTMVIDCGTTPLATADVVVLGGIGTNTGFGEIYACGTLNLKARRHIYVNRTVPMVPIFQNGPARIVSNSAMTLNQQVLGTDLIVFGGADPLADGLLQSLSSTITWGSTGLGGGLDLIVGDPDCQAPAQILTSTGTSFFHFNGDMTVQGGMMHPMAPPAAFAQIHSDVGSFQFVGGVGVNVTGGTGPDCFAEISSNLGNVLIEDLMGDITLTGGSGVMATNAYAQIGRGIGQATRTVQSNLTFNNIGGGVTLTALDGPGAYVQIGHSPIDPTGSSATGNITFPLGMTGSLSLNGGSATNATAIIGFGNELTPTLQTVNGLIQLGVSGPAGTSLIAGTVPQTHAIIGVCNPTGGSSLPFGCNLTSLTLNCQNGPVHLLATDGSNATIGYYNATPQMSAVNLTIHSIRVDTQGAQDILLEAGNDGGTFAGVASIGTLVDTLGSTAFSNITVIAKDLTLKGPIMMQDGSARIVNSVPNSVNPLFNVTIQQAANINVWGGLGTTAGFADIYSSNNLAISFSGDFFINEAPMLQNGYAHVVANRNIDINTAAVGMDIRLTGGTSGVADALIQSLDGHVFIGGFSPNVQNIYIGRAASMAPSTIEAFQDMIAIANTLDLVLQGGSMNAGPPEATAQIRNLNGSITVSSGRDVTLTGGTGPTTYAQIGSFHNDVTFTEIGRNLFLTGGSGLQAYAQIGIGIDLTEFTISSNISFNSIQGIVTLQGALAGDSGYAQIGLSPFGTMSFYSATGNVSFPFSGSFGPLTLNGGLVDNSSAIIGHGNPLTSFLTSAMGTVGASSADMMTGVTLNPGTGSESHAVIGFFSPSGGSMPSFSVNSFGVSVNAPNGPVTLNGGAGTNATIGYYNAVTPSPIDVDITLLTVTTGTGAPPPNQFVVLNAGTGAPAGGIASIGTFGPIGATTASNIDITTYELDLNGPIMGNDGAARVINSQPGVCSPFDIAITTTNLNILGGLGTGFSDIYSANDLTISFNGTMNVNLDPASPLTLQDGNATITSCADLTTASNGGITGDIFVLGGSNFGVLSQMSSTMGNVFMGNVAMGIQGVDQVNIGRADMLGPARIFSAMGSLDLNSTGPVFVTGGFAAGAFADLNSELYMRGMILGNLTVTGGNGAGTDALISSDTGPLSLIATGSVNLTAPAGSSASIVQVGSANGSLQVEAVLDLNLGANTFIQNQGNGSTVLNFRRNAFVTGDGFIENVGSGPMTFITGVSMFLLDTSLIRTHGGAMALVVDDLFPTPPGIGNGAFHLGLSVTLDSDGGALRIFTARRPLNTIQGLINAFPFVPGIEFIDTDEEIWRTYYFSNRGGTPFTIFYKDFLNVPEVITSYRQSNNEYFKVIEVYDDFLYSLIPLPVSFDLDGFVRTFHGNSLSSAQLFPERVYGSFRRLYRDYRLKVIDPLR